MDNTESNNHPENLVSTDTAKRTHDSLLRLQNAIATKSRQKREPIDLSRLARRVAEGRTSDTLETEAQPAQDTNENVFREDEGAVLELAEYEMIDPPQVLAAAQDEDEQEQERWAPPTDEEDHDPTEDGEITVAQDVAQDTDTANTLTAEYGIPDPQYAGQAPDDTAPAPIPNLTPAPTLTVAPVLNPTPTPEPIPTLTPIGASAPIPRLTPVQAKTQTESDKTAVAGMTSDEMAAVKALFGNNTVMTPQGDPVEYHKSAAKAVNDGYAAPDFENGELIFRMTAKAADVIRASIEKDVEILQGKIELQEHRIRTFEKTVKDKMEEIHDLNRLIKDTQDNIELGRKLIEDTRASLSNLPH